MDLFDKIANKQILLADLTNQELADFCIFANQQYRLGKQIISDSDYDFVFLKELQKRLPNHLLLQKVEADFNAFGENKLLLPQIMLSTDKAFSIDELTKWQQRIFKVANEISFNSQKITIKITAKLDGFAAFDDGKILYSRGDGKKGSDISRVFKRGLQVYENNKRGLGAGEIVVKKSYFDKYLATKFENSRNFQASILREKNLDEFSTKAIKDGAAVFVPFSTLPAITLKFDEVFTNFESFKNEILTSVDFDTDGIILEVVEPELKTAMGANRKFHRWMIAFKENKESAQVEVKDIIPQVGRTGKITPVAKLNPTKISGALLTYASCYHYNFIKINNLGKGSVVELIRSGLVIPKIIKVLESTQAKIPTNCPSCESELNWQSDFLICENKQNCPEQIITKMEYFFATLANNDGFGKATINKLFHHKITQITQIYQLSLADFMGFGFGEKTAQNLLDNLQKSRTTQIEDYRFLASFGIERLGIGNSDTLLQKYDITDIFELSTKQISAIDGFAEISAKAIIEGLKQIKEEFLALFKLNFNLEKTKVKTTTDNYFSGKKLVFTGTMQNSREQMQKNAKNMGAIIQKAVSGKTDFLIIGAKVGASKLAKAQELKIKIITEKQYFDLIST